MIYRFIDIDKCMLRFGDYLVLLLFALDQNQPIVSFTNYISIF